MPLPTRLPFSFGGPTSSGLYTQTGYGYNYAIGGLPFLSAASREHPLIRQTAQYKKQQFDAQQSPGEQSMDGWWLRSQQSFHDGAGLLFGDPSASDDTYSPNRFYRSKGVDPWTPGQISLLPRTTAVSADPIAALETDGTRALGWTTANRLSFISPAGVYTTEAVPFATVRAVSLDGSNYIHATDSDIWRRSYGSAPGSAWTNIWDLGSTRPYVVVKWVKERLVLATDLGVYELSGVGLPLPAPKWTPPSGAWQPTSITESNAAIYVAGITTGGRSLILSFTLNASGTMPTLASGVVVAALPQGELIGDIFGYLGKFIAISTSKGPRIATINTDGSLEVGPLLFSGATYNWVARGQYLYTPAVMPEFTGLEGGLARVDLGREVSPLRFAYATDVYSATAGGPATVAGLLNDKLYFGNSSGLSVEVPGQYVNTGYLLGSRVRFGTLEPKLYKLLRTRGPILQSDYFASVITPNGSEYNVAGWVSGQTPGDRDVGLPSLGPQDYLSVRFTLSSNAAHTASAVASGYQLKALPAQPRQRMYQIPLWCFDREVDRYGMFSGVQGSALSRLLALEALDKAADTVQLQDLDNNLVDLVSIEGVEFLQTAGPDERFTGWGGLINLTVRTI